VEEPEGIHYQSWSPEYVHIIYINSMHRQRTDLQA